MSFISSDSLYTPPSLSIPPGAHIIHMLACMIMSHKPKKAVIFPYSLYFPSQTE